MTLTEAEMRGWATIRLIAAICNRNEEKIHNLSLQLTLNYEDKEIKQIWRKAKQFLSDEDIAWLEKVLSLACCS